MNQIQDYARTRLADLFAQPLLRTLASDPSATRSLQILPYVTFWSNVFQDIITLNLERVSDPELRAIVQKHHDEDAGHNYWLAEDVRLIYRGLPDVLALFDREYLHAREFPYAFMSEVYRAESDWERLAFVIVLEEGSTIIVPPLIEHFRRAGLGAHFKALGQRHVDAEAAHELHGDDVWTALGAMRVPDDARARSIAMVERSHATFLRFMRMLDAVIMNPSPEREVQIRARLDELAIRPLAVGDLEPGRPRHR